MYEWENKLIVFDRDTGSWHTSVTGWVEIFRHILSNNEKKLNQKEMHSILRSAFVRYFLQNPNALVITREDNYNKLNDNYKHLAIFLVDANGYLRVNYTGRQAGR